LGQELATLPPPGWRFLGKGLAGGLFEEHDEGVQEVIRKDLQGAAGNVVAEKGRYLAFIKSSRDMPLFLISPRSNPGANSL